MKRGNIGVRWRFIPWHGPPVLECRKVLFIPRALIWKVGGELEDSELFLSLH